MRGIKKWGARQLRRSLTCLVRLMEYSARGGKAQKGNSMAEAADIRLRRSAPAGKEPNALYWSISLGWIVVLAWQVVAHPERLASDADKVIAWTLAVLVMNVTQAISSRSALIAVDQPFHIAAALVLSPAEAGLVAFLGCLDRREVTGQTTFGKAVCNRSVGAWAVLLASATAHTLAPEALGSGALIFLLAIVMIVVQTASNLAFVALAIAVKKHDSVVKILPQLFVGSPADLALTVTAWAILGGMLALLYTEIGLWALPVGVGPTLLTRQALTRSEMFLQARRESLAQARALVRISDQAYEERREERRLIAADLHDEVMQPLFKVSLLAQVLKQDLDTGRLLEMDQDLPELLASTEIAATALRTLIGNLRRSNLAAGDLAPAISRLIEEARTHTTVNIHTKLPSFSATPEQELTIYQIAKEALSNALSHAKAKNVWVEVESEPDGTYLSVRDDGIGFDTAADKEGHFGLHIMRERASAVGGSLYVDSHPGAGCKLLAVIPLASDAQPGT
jgi:signal transduction histidine kinase